MIYFVALLSGALFGLGLTVSMMSDPEKVLAFLDVAGRWDPSLALVLVAAVATTAIGYRFVWRLSKPSFAGAFLTPDRTRLDRPLLVGAAVFGVGWGLAGFCPGPAFAALLIGGEEPLIFLLSMGVGFVIVRWFR
ncbi:MAG: YeeE/YedE family protein [Gammaproteobacteria bacterium]|nr:YeeE/YedE family protein [Gammaproteobacteria bacterium]